MRRALAAIAAALLASTAAPPARADTPPSAWDRARDPAAADRYRLHLEVQRRLAQRERLDVRESQALTVRTKLEEAGAATSPDVRLRFDLGAVYLFLEQYDKAAEVLKGALAMAPDHPAAEDSWLRLAFACGHNGDHDCERRAYVEVLRRTTEEVARATPILNLAETEMHLGHLRDAIDGYREALRIAGRVPARETAPLAEWGLAVALDRSGDRIAAEKEARTAIALERSMGMRRLLRSSGVFFVPAYEIHWYEGLGYAAEAREAKSARDAARLFRAAEQSFSAYVRAAEPVHDRWLEIAKARLAAVRADRAKADKRAGKQRPEGLDEDGDVML